MKGTQKKDEINKSYISDYFSVNKSQILEMLDIFSIPVSLCSAFHLCYNADLLFASITKDILY